MYFCYKKVRCWVLGVVEVVRLVVVVVNVRSKNLVSANENCSNTYNSEKAVVNMCLLTGNKRRELSCLLGLLLTQ